MLLRFISLWGKVNVILLYFLLVSLHYKLCRYCFMSFYQCRRFIKTCSHGFVLLVKHLLIQLIHKNYFRFIHFLFPHHIYLKMFVNCLDQTPPTITCPEHVTAESEPGQAYKEISYLQPTVVDNSITGEDEITVLQNPSSIKSPYEFPIGVTIINFTATDPAGNSDACIFRVEIEGESKTCFHFLVCEKGLVLLEFLPYFQAPTFTDHHSYVVTSNWTFFFRSRKAKIYLLPEWHFEHYWQAISNSKICSMGEANVQW